MFSDSSRGHKSIKTHGSHFLPWLRNSLKGHQTQQDGNLNGSVKSKAGTTENRKGMGFFSSIQSSKDREIKKGCPNGVARVLPVVLRGHHILSGKQREDSPARWTQSPELDPEVSIAASELDKSLVQVNHSETLMKSSPQNLAPPPQIDQTSSSSATCTTLRRYGPLFCPPVLQDDSSIGSSSNPPPVVGVFVDNKEEKVWDYSSRSFRQRDLHSASWVGPDTQSILKRHQFTSSFSFIHQQHQSSRNSQSHRDLTSLRDSHLDRALNGVLLSTQVAQRGPGCTKTLRGPRKPRPSSERITSLEQQSWFQPDLIGVKRTVGENKRKAVRNQIKRVMDNLEHVLGALRDVQQEMKEVVQQIDFLTSSIDLNEDEPPETRTQSSSNSSSSSAATVGSVIHRPMGAAPSDGRDAWGDNQSAGRTHSPPASLRLPPVTPESAGTLRFGSRKAGAGVHHQQHQHQTDSLAQTLTTSPVSPQRSLPVRPPTPGLSPLTVSMQHPNSPVSPPESQPESPSQALSSTSLSQQSPSYLRPPPPFYPTLKRDKSSQSGRTSGALSLILSNAQQPQPSTSAVNEAERGERRALSAGDVPVVYHMMTLPLKPKGGQQQGRKGRKPPPYPHHRLHETLKPHHRLHETLNPHHRLHETLNPHHRLHETLNPHHRLHETLNPHHRLHETLNPHHRLHETLNPHHRLHETLKPQKEPRKAPPYPEKKKLLSTTV